MNNWKMTAEDVLKQGPVVPVIVIKNSSKPFL